MKFISKISFLAGAIGLNCLFAFMSIVHANQANPNPIFEKQPDGTIIEVRLKGDEHFHWSEDKNGYTILLHQGWYKYANKNNNGRLTASEHVVGQANPKALGLQKRIKPSAAVQAESSKKLTDENTPQRALQIGTVKNLVVLLRFANHAESAVGAGDERPLPSVSDMEVLFNNIGGDPILAPTGSIKDLYLENSYGQFTLDSNVQAWITLSETEEYYANGQSGDQTLWEGLREALFALDASVNFSDYDADGDGYIDAITFIHSGYGAETGGTSADGAAQDDRIWSHRWAMQSSAWTSEEGVTVNDYHISPGVWGKSGFNIGRIGVIAHETGHFLGLPDLYDTNGGGEGIGSYGLMANSWDFDGTQYCPPHLSPWSKTQLGWYIPQVINVAGKYTLAQTEQMSDNIPQVYKITQGFPNDEYLLIENRQNFGFDCTLPQGGLAIWHIDDRAGYNTEGYPGQFRWPKNGNHYRVALLQADGKYDLEKGNNRGDAGDVYHSDGVDIINEGPDGHPNTDAYQQGRVRQTGNSINTISASGSTMTFCLNDCSPAPPPPPPPPSDGLAAPTNLIVSVENLGKGKYAAKRATLNWIDNSSDADGFKIERCHETGKGKNKVCDFEEIDTVISRKISFTDVELSGTYKYCVKAYTLEGLTSLCSNEVKI